MPKKKYIFGNWKMNKNLHEITKFFSVFNKKKFIGKNIIYGFAPSFLGLGLASNLKKSQTIIIAQDVCENENGGCTGQVSCKQLKDYKINYAIVGHSDARKYLGCTDKTVNKKIKICLANKITPIVCIGETLNQHNKKQTKKILLKQLKIAFNNIDASKCIIAYEPLWAIGSGKMPALKNIDNLCNYIKSIIKHPPVLYGGSVNEDNAHSIISLKHVDGLLIGRTSLDPDKMIKIISTESNKKRV